MPSETLILAALALTCTGVIAAAALRAWDRWLAFKREELHAGAQGEGVPSSIARIEMADLRERLRKLEAIASGVDL